MRSFHTKSRKGDVDSLNELVEEEQPCWKDSKENVQYLASCRAIRGILRKSRHQVLARSNSPRP